MRGKKKMGTLLAGCVVAGAISVTSAGVASARDCDGYWSWENGQNVCVVTVEGNGWDRGDRRHGNGCPDRCGPSEQYLEHQFRAREIGIPGECWDPWRPETIGWLDIVVFNDGGNPIWLKYDDRLNRGARYEPRRFHDGSIWFVRV